MRRDLSNSLVEGTLPIELRELDALQKLYLQGNRQADCTALLVLALSRLLATVYQAAQIHAVPLGHAHQPPVMSGMCAAPCRFSGVLPAEWGEPLYFPSLQQLDLSSNLLNSTLPNREWNSRDSWPALVKLNLASNYFYGG